MVACTHGVYQRDYVPVGNCSEDMGHNATMDEVIFSLSKGNDLNGTFVSSQHYLIISHNLECDYGPQRHHHNNCNSTTTPSAMMQSLKPGCSAQEEEYTYRYTGMCDPNDLIFSDSFTDLYLHVYHSFYGICVLFVFLLYFLLFRTVVKSRAWRRKQKSKALSPIRPLTNNSCTNGTPAGLVSNGKHVDGIETEQNPKMICSIEDENVDRVVVVGIVGSGGDGTDSYKPTRVAMPDSGICRCEHTAAGSDRVHKMDNRENTTGDAGRKKTQFSGDSDLLANIRTAFILFVVTVVFVITFLPASLMATRQIEFHATVFYMYYINSVANPVIYAIMNKSFRKELKRVFQRRTHFS